MASATTKFDKVTDGALSALCVFVAVGLLALAFLPEQRLLKIAILAWLLFP